MSEPNMRIGEVARRADVRVSLLRYYEDVGLLPAAERVSGQRRYDETVLRRLAVIDVAQRAGLSLAEIRELLEHGSRPVSEPLRALAERRLPEIDALIERAGRVRRWLAEATECRCQTIDDCALFDAPGPDRGDRDRPRAQPPAAGDLVVTDGRAPRDRRHQVPKQKTPAGPRVSVNFTSRAQWHDA